MHAVDVGSPDGAGNGHPRPATDCADLPASAVGPVPEWLDLQIRDRALQATGACFTITDPRQPDNPLIWANPAFERVTGYSLAEVVGRNCRFLQNGDDDQPALAELRAGLAAGRHVVVVLRNYRRDGTPFWNELAISPVFDPLGEITHFVGVQTDVTERVEAQLERDRLFERERAARGDAERATAQLQLLADVSELLSGTLDVGEALDRLTKAVVPTAADWCSVHVLPPRSAPTRTDSEAMGPRRVITHHRDPRLRTIAERSQLLQAELPTAASAVVQVLRTGRPVLRERIDPEGLRAALRPEGRADELVGLLEELGLATAVATPLLARGRVLGALVMARSSGSYTADDLRLAEDLGRRAGTAIDNARLYRAEHTVSESLQRSLLPTIPELPGLAFAARYLPTAATATVGGDWFDVLALPDGAAGVAIGDVMGHDIAAAAAMGQLSSVLRSYAWEGHRPAIVLDRLDRLVQGLEMAQLATCLYAWIQVNDAGFAQGAAAPAFMRWANAGHLPPLLLTPDGRARLLGSTGAPPTGTPAAGLSSAEAGVLIGAGGAESSPRPELRILLPAGSHLVLYTDGLVESRDLDLDDGLERLRLTAEKHAPEDGPEALVDLIVDQMLTGRRQDDDVAILGLRVLAGPD
ncbi:PAS domain-containing protein [Parafrankia sp. BMG5.11]|nr:PAS domain-containing protein [Parafrankia sp. BMG5.11]SQD94404.1 putative PAS/PAC sensor protein [Parafrankia sp. Ea1.12]